MFARICPRYFDMASNPPTPWGQQACEMFVSNPESDETKSPDPESQNQSSDSKIQKPKYRNPKSNKQMSATSKIQGPEFKIRCRNMIRDVEIGNAIRDVTEVLAITKQCQNQGRSRMRFAT